MDYDQLRETTLDPAKRTIIRVGVEDAVLAGHENVYVIHGKGTGALRSALWQYFRQDKKRIKSFRMGKYGEGDLGVTVLELKVKK